MKMPMHWFLISLFLLTVAPSATLGQTGSVPANQDAPHSGDVADPTPQVEAPAQPTPAPAQAQAPDPNELVPNAQPDPNELKPNVTPADNALPAPTQVNQINSNTPQNATANSNKNDGNEEADVQYSSSKHNKKKGIKKVLPF